MVVTENVTIKVPVGMKKYMTMDDWDTHMSYTELIEMWRDSNGN